MSSTLDNVITVVLFVVGAGVMIFFGVTGVFRLGVEVRPRLVAPPRGYKVADLAAEVVPVLLLAGAFAMGVVLAALNSGLTFFYPLIAVPLGVVAWNLALNSLIKRLCTMRSGQRTVEDAQFDQRREAERQADGEAETRG